jgi:hypothetical protein
MPATRLTTGRARLRQRDDELIGIEAAKKVR